MKFFNTYFMYSFLLWTIIIISILICLLILSLVVINIRYANKEREIKVYTEKYIDLISSYVTGKNIKLDHITNDLEYQVIADICDNTLIDISGQQAEKLQTLLYSLGVVDYYKKMAHSKSWIKKYVAIEKLEFFRDKSLKSFFMEMLDEEFANDKVNLKLITALSFIADIEAVKFITVKLAKILNRENTLSNKLIEHIYTNAIKNLEENDGETELIEYMNQIKFSEDIPKIIKTELLLACGSTYMFEANKMIIDYFYSSDDTEIKASAIKAIGKIGLAESQEVIIDALQDKSWVIRMLAAKTATICDLSAIPNLKLLLNDSEYYVRLNAAKTLSHLGEQGLDVLINAKESENIFDNDTVNYVLDLNMNHIS